MENKSNLILVVEEKDEKLFNEVKSGSGWETERKTFPEATEALKNVSPQVVIFNVEHSHRQVKEILGNYRSFHPKTYWALSGAPLAAEELVEFMRLGALDFIPRPLTEKDFKSFLQRVEAWHKSYQDTPAGKGPRTLSFFSPKGGVGLTLCAVNLAAALARKKVGTVLVADFVLQHGTVAESLDLPRQFTVLDLAQNFDRMDKNLLEKSVQKPRPGLAVLPSPSHPEESEFMTTKDAAAMVQMAKDTFDYVVFDMGHELNTLSLIGLDHSDLIFLITTPDLPSLCNTKAALQTFKKLGYTKDKVKLVLNRWKMKGEIETSVIEKNLDYPVFHKICDDTVTPLQSLNQGVPLFEISKNAEIVKCLDAMADQIAARNVKGA